MTTAKNRSLDELVFDNRFTNELPADPEDDNRPRQVFGSCYSRVQPLRVPEPRLVAFSREMAQELDLSDETCRSQVFADVFAGNRVLDGMDCQAMCYGGHQFGHWAGQLGDGRAINLGEVVNLAGQRLALQLKGAGPTPYSRSGDGLAVLRSSVREFLCSEAMHHLGVPTTRALSLVLTGVDVERDMFYNGNPQLEPGAVVCRIAPSFLRFGNYEIFASRGETKVLRQLADYTITTHFPELGTPGKETYLRWFEEVCRRTAVMVVHWMRVGFVHGVMNTDNMSILGLTIDYGPYGWLDDYDPDWTPNTTDAEGRRYRYGYQPQIALWNLARLAEALFPLVEAVEPLEEALQAYGQTFEEERREMMAGKLGLEAFREEDNQLVEGLFKVLQLVETDMTIFYRRLAELSKEEVSVSSESMRPLEDAWYSPEEVSEDHRAEMGRWVQSYVDRLRLDERGDEARRQSMNAVNPKYVLRNYVAQLAIDRAEGGDGSLVRDLLDVMRRPYDEQPGQEEYAAKRPEWARHRPGCSMLSCSS